MAPRVISPEIRFRRYFVERPCDECWPWTGRTVWRGYGQFSLWPSRIPGGNIRAHRYAWILRNGEIPDGLFVCHRCDNPPCVNPDHLFLGTHQDNMDDMDKKGRRALAPRGQSHYASKLSEDDVRVIRQMLRDGHSAASVATGFGVASSVISEIKTGKAWKSVA